MDVLRTKIGGWTYLFPLGAVARVFEAPAPEGNVVRWHDGEYAVTDLAGAWGGEAPVGASYYVELLGAEPTTAVRVSSLEGVQRMPDGGGVTLQPWWFAAGEAACSQAFRDRGELLLLIDPSALLHLPKGDN